MREMLVLSCYVGRITAMENWKDNFEPPMEVRELYRGFWHGYDRWPRSPVI